MKKTFVYLVTGLFLLLLSNNSQAANLIYNSDFELGNTGFYTEYEYKTPDNNNVLWPEQTYAVVNDPSLVHTEAVSLSDHTTGNGLMMVVNGAPVENKIVWAQNIAVTQNQDYIFSAWINNWVSRSSSVIDFRINNKTVGTFSLDTPELQAKWDNHEWIHFETVWNSDSVDNALLSIVDLNTIRSGNDFILDDLNFAPTPAPEPSSIILGLLGLSGAFRIRRKKSA